MRTGSPCQVRVRAFRATSSMLPRPTRRLMMLTAPPAGHQLLGAQVHLTLLDALRDALARGVINTAEVSSTELLTMVKNEARRLPAASIFCHPLSCGISGGRQRAARSPSSSGFISQHRPERAGYCQLAPGAISEWRVICPAVAFFGRGKKQSRRARSSSLRATLRWSQLAACPSLSQKCYPQRLSAPSESTSETTPCGRRRPRLQWRW